ncbi:MAG: SDR family NAD(P)-dependent oxidoreductase [Methyloligellaceae bacterium]
MVESVTPDQNIPSTDAPPRQDHNGVTVITGGSEGLGLSLAHQFAGAGHALLLVARTESALEASAQALRTMHPVTVQTVVADLSTEAGRDAVEAAVHVNGLHVEFLVNNAGVGNAGPFAEADASEIEHMLQLNVLALTDLTRRFLPDMIARDHGGVLNVASLGGLVPGPFQSAYYASKAYVVSVTEALAAELSRTGLRISVLAPGVVKTQFHVRMGVKHDYYLKVLPSMDPDRVARITFNGFMRGRTVIVPGLFSRANALAIKLLPHAIVVPVTRLLLRRRQGRAQRA